MRRICAGTDEDGKSLIVDNTTVGSKDGPVIFRVGGGLPSIRLPEIPDHVSSSDAVIVHLWESISDATTDIGLDRAAQVTDFSMEPELGGLFFRYHVWGPGRVSKPHATSTLDLMFVISGEVTLLLDREDVTLVPGDALVLQAASHGWRAGDEGCTFVHVMRKMD